MFVNFEIATFKKFNKKNFRYLNYFNNVYMICQKLD